MISNIVVILNVGVCLPIIVELISDINSKDKFRGIWPYSLFTFSETIYNILLICFSGYQERTFEVIFSFFLNLRWLVTVFCCINYLRNFGDEFWISTQGVGISMLFFLNPILNVCNILQDTTSIIVNNLCSFIIMLEIISYLSIFVLFLNKKITIPKQEVFPSYALVYIVLLLSTICDSLATTMLFRVFLSATYPSMYSHFISVVSLISVIAVAVCHARVARRDIILSQLIAKNLLVRQISHEIRTPLNTVFLGLNLLQRELSQGGNLLTSLETIKDIQESCNISLEVLNEMLTLEKIREGLLTLDCSFFTASIFIQDTVRTFRIQAKQAGIKLVITTKNINILKYSLFADYAKLGHVIRNFVSNALKFTVKGGTVTIIMIGQREERPINSKSSGVTKMSNQVYASIQKSQMKSIIDIEPLIPASFTVQVVDNGAGISKDNQKRVFNEIIQFNPNKLQRGGGSGLGLYISKGISDLHDGIVSVHSDGEGLGCTFSLVLPAWICPSKVVIAPPCIVPYHSKSTLHSVIRSVSYSSFITTDVHTPHATTMTPRSCRPPGIAIETTTAASTPITGGGDSTKSCYTPETGEARPDNEPVVTPPPPPSGLTVMIVDDSQMSRKMMARILAPYCKAILAAEDGAIAVDMAQKCLTAGETIDVIFMDYHLPNMIGPVATQLIRDMGFAGLIVAVTGHAFPADIQIFRNAGANEVLIKPVTASQLDQVLREGVPPVAACT